MKILILLPKIFLLILSFVFKYETNDLKQCSESLISNQISHLCKSNKDCLDTGLGNECCWFNQKSFCLRDESLISPDCVIYEGNFTGDRIVMSNGEFRINLNYSSEFGYRSIKLSNSNCRLKLCYKSDKIQKCFNHISGDYYKEKKPLPNFISCDCTSFNKIVPEKIFFKNFTNKVSFLRPSEATVIFNFDHLKIPNNFYIKIGNLNFKYLKNRIYFENITELKFNSKITKLINNFKSLWVSFKSSEKSFIKIGHDFLKEKNIINFYESTDLNTAKLLKQIDQVTLDESISLKKRPEIMYKSFYHDPNPLVLNINDDYLNINNFNFTLLINLPKEIQQLYLIINSINLNNDILDWIEYSINNKNCLLEQLFRKKSLTNYNREHFTIDILINKIDNYYYVLKIYPKLYKNSFHSYDPFGLLKIYNGDFMIQFENNQTYKLSSGNLTWFTKDFNRNYLIQNLRNNKVSVAIQTVKYLFSADYLYEEFLNLIKIEYSNKLCEDNYKIFKKCKCNFNNRSIDGKTLKKIHFKCLSDINNINDQLSYFCNTSTGEIQELKSIESEINPNKAIAKISPAYDKNITGLFIFEQIKNNLVRIRGNISGLLANSYHAMHIHEYGSIVNDCRDTGPHFNPYMNDQHGDKNDHKYHKHAGDLGNIKTDNNGNGFVNIEVSVFNIQNDNYYSVLYRSIVIHINRDDLGRGNHSSSKSNGNSGTRIACGIILPTDLF